MPNYRVLTTVVVALGFVASQGCGLPGAQDAERIEPSPAEASGSWFERATAEINRDILESAEPDPDDVVLLRGATTLRCEFEDIGSETIIDAIEWEDASSYGSARLIGGVGSSDLLAVRGRGGSSFIEVTPSGTVNLITVYAWRIAEIRDSVIGMRFVAVFSRHTAIGGPSPAQLHGSCVAFP